MYVLQRFLSDYNFPVLSAGGVAVDDQKTEWDSVLAGGESVATQKKLCGLCSLLIGTNLNWD